MSRSSSRGGAKTGNPVGFSYVCVDLAAYSPKGYPMEINIPEIVEEVTEAFMA